MKAVISKPTASFAQNLVGQALVLADKMRMFFDAETRAHAFAKTPENMSSSYKFTAVYM